MVAYQHGWREKGWEELSRQKFARWLRVSEVETSILLPEPLTSQRTVRTTVPPNIFSSSAFHVMKWGNAALFTNAPFPRYCTAEPRERVVRVIVGSP